MLGCMHFFLLQTLHLLHTTSKKCLQPLMSYNYNLALKEVIDVFPAFVQLFCNWSLKLHFFRCCDKYEFVKSSSVSWSQRKFLEIVFLSAHFNIVTYNESLFKWAEQEVNNKVVAVTMRNSVCVFVWVSQLVVLVLPWIIWSWTWPDIKWLPYND